MMLNQSALSTFSAVCSCVRRYYRQDRPLWHSIRTELANDIALLPLMKVRWSSHLSEQASCSDATLRGYAAQVGRWNKEQVLKAYQWSDRWRFVLEPEADPRVKTLYAGLSDA